MCWNGEASTMLAAIGLGTTAIAAYRKEPTALWLTLGYFSTMEALQAFTYTVIDNCDSPANQVATLLGYLHIVFQPFFINLISLYFIPTEVRQRIQGWVYFVCFVGMVFMLVKLYPFSWAGECLRGDALCGTPLCSVSGNWHIAWLLPLNNVLSFFDNFINPSSFYFLSAFILPVLYGSWKLTLYHVVMGPTLAFLTTNNMNEQPAVWCLLSIGFLLIVIKTPLRSLLHVYHWWWSIGKKSLLLDQNVDESDAKGKPTLAD